MTTQNAVIVTPELDIKIIDIQTNCLKQLQEAVQGLIQPIDFHERVTMWVNEEFLFTDLARNPFASGIYSEMYGERHSIYGTVVFTGGPDEEGNTLGLSPEDIEVITSTADLMRQALAERLAN